jgi:hypothetical protein
VLAALDVQRIERLADYGVAQRAKKRHFTVGGGRSARVRAIGELFSTRWCIAGSQRDPS